MIPDTADNEDTEFIPIETIEIDPEDRTDDPEPQLSVESHSSEGMQRQDTTNIVAAHLENSSVILPEDDFVDVDLNNQCTCTATDNDQVGIEYQM